MRADSVLVLSRQAFSSSLNFANLLRLKLFPTFPKTIDAVHVFHAALRCSILNTRNLSVKNPSSDLPTNPYLHAN